MKNVAQWCSLGVSPVEIKTYALSDRDGEAVLGFPDDYRKNHGEASLESTKDGVPVVRRLDSLDIGTIGVMKIDVEGHEASVLAGAEKMLHPRRLNPGCSL